MDNCNDEDCDLDHYHKYDFSHISSTIRNCDCCGLVDMTGSDLVMCNPCSTHCNDNECLQSTEKCKHELGIRIQADYCNLCGADLKSYQPDLRIPDTNRNWNLDSMKTSIDKIKGGENIMKEETKHHIEESKKLLEQGRFTLQDVGEKLSFLMSDLWLVMERLDSIKKLEDGN